MQDLLVILIVLGAASYAVWYWLPVAWRQRLGRVHPALMEAPSCNACESSCGGCAKAVDGASPEDGLARRVIPIVPERKA